MPRRQSALAQDDIGALKNKDFVEMFKEKGIVTYFEQHIGYWAFQDEELMAKIKAFEEKWNALVFAATHEYCEFGECYHTRFNLSKRRKTT
jgi:hypothetical protein